MLFVGAEEPWSVDEGWSHSDDSKLHPPSFHGADCVVGEDPPRVPELQCPGHHSEEDIVYRVVCCSERRKTLSAMNWWLPANPVLLGYKRQFQSSRCLRQPCWA